MIRPPVEPERPDYEDEENLPPTVHVYAIDGWCVRCGVSELVGERAAFKFDCAQALARERNRRLREKYGKDLEKYEHQKFYYEELISEYEGPYHVVNELTGKHLGPFTTKVDASLARAMSSSDSWARGRDYNKREFDEYLSSFVARTK